MSRTSSSWPLEEREEEEEEEEEERGWIHMCSSFFRSWPPPESADELATAGVPYLAGLVHGASGHHCPLIVEQGTGYLSSMANQSVQTSVGVPLPLTPLIDCGW